MPELADNPTQKQLDELDQLLQKMLGVPNGASDTASKPIEKPKANLLSPSKMSNVGYSTPAESPSPPAFEPPKDGWSIDLNPRQSSSVLGDRSPLRGGGSLPPLEPPPRPDNPSPAAMLQLNTLAGSPLPPIGSKSQGGEPVSLLMMPFAIVTNSFDATASLLGPLGRLVSSSFGRSVMGLTGLALLAGSGLWFASVWFGW